MHQSLDHSSATILSVVTGFLASRYVKISRKIMMAVWHLLVLLTRAFNNRLGIIIFSFTARRCEIEETMSLTLGKYKNACSILHRGFVE